MVLGWVDDFWYFIWYFGLWKYCVFGVSGGIFYVFVCVKLFFKDEIFFVGVVFGIVFWEVGLKGLSIYNCLGMFIWGYFLNIMVKVLDKELVILVY